jgi:foldase protein PrsA
MCFERSDSMSRRMCVVAILALLIVAIPTLAAPPKLPDVVAVVNGEKITKDQLISTLIDWQSVPVLDQLIMQRLVGQEARKVGVVVTPEQVKARLDEYRKQSSAFGQNFDEMMRSRGFTPGYIFASLKMRMQAEGIIKKRLKITPEEADQYRRASHILIRVQPSSSSSSSNEEQKDGDKKEDKDAEAKAKIEKIAEEIKNGLSFEEAVAKYSEDENSKAKNGDLGFFQRNDMLPEFSKVVFDELKKVGEISGPVKTLYGYHLIKLTALGKTARGKDREDLRETIYNRKLPEEYNTLMLSLRNKGKIENFLVPQESKTAQPAKATTPPAPKEKKEVQPTETPPPPPSEPDDSSQSTQSSSGDSEKPADNASSAEGSPPAPSQ